MSGRRADVFIEHVSGRGYRVWADPGMKDTIKSVEGVTDVFTITSDFEYDVYLDPRYDADYVIKEIEAEIKCRDD